ncbi:MAG: hypothetical protein F6K14_02235 [Symploca sp. SIO2C1]|nr:hypothetical protein [Symploca sp. SIO2C1]
MAKLTLLNIVDETKVFQAPQPPILGELRLKVPRGIKSEASSGFPIEPRAKHLLASPLLRGTGGESQGDLGGFGVASRHYEIFRQQRPLR